MAKLIGMTDLAPVERDLRRRPSSRCRPGVSRRRSEPALERRLQIVSARDLAARSSAAALLAGAGSCCRAYGVVDPRLLPPLSRRAGDAGQASSAGRRSTRRSASPPREVIVAFIIAVPLGAAIGVLAAENDYFGQIFKPHAVLRLQRAEIDLPADVHPDLRHRLPAEGRLRGLLDRLHRHHERDGRGRIGEGRPRAGRALLRRHARADPARASTCRA